MPSAERTLGVSSFISPRKGLLGSDLSFRMDPPFQLLSLVTVVSRTQPLYSCPLSLGRAIHINDQGQQAHYKLVYAMLNGPT